MCKWSPLRRLSLSSNAGTPSAVYSATAIHSIHHNRTVKMFQIHDPLGGGLQRLQEVSYQ